MARPKKVENGGSSITAAVSSAIKGDKTGFNLNKFKESKNLVNNSKYKEQTYIPASPAVQEIISLPGIPQGHITLLRGHSDTGKTTALLEIAINAQKRGILPVFIVTEMKWSWQHAMTMGLEVNEIPNKDGEVVDYDGFFVYADRSSLNTVEDVAAFILDLIDEQAKGNLPYDLVFLWDSVGSIPCRQSVESNKNSNEWNAGAMSQQFGNFVNQKILMSRKISNPYTNTLVCVNKIWVARPTVPMEQPKMQNKGGNAMFSDATIILTFGNITNAGTSKIKATKDGKEVEFAKRTKVSCDKNHLTGITTKGTMIATIHGFILEDEINDYKKAHSDEWAAILGAGEFDVVESKMEEENNRDIPVGDDAE
jgi:hypothetical protein